MQDVDVSNGCMWFVPGSHREAELRPHRPAKEGHHIKVTDMVDKARKVIIIGMCFVNVIKFFSLRAFPSR